MNNFIVVFCTVDTEENAKKISHTLVSEKLAACVNIINNVNSVYSWENKIVQDKELLLVIKTQKELFNKIEERIKQIHPYTVPEIISLDITQGSKSYLEWIKNNTLL